MFSFFFTFLNSNVKRVKMVILDKTAMIPVLLLNIVKPVAQNAAVLKTNIAIMCLDVYNPKVNIRSFLSG